MKELILSLTISLSLIACNNNITAMHSYPIAEKDVSTDIFSTMQAQMLNKQKQWVMAHERVLGVVYLFIH